VPNFLGKIGGLVAMFLRNQVGGLTFRHESHDFTPPSTELGFASVTGTVGAHELLILKLGET
jgi:hypothetical protein